MLCVGKEEESVEVVVVWHPVPPDTSQSENRIVTIINQSQVSIEETIQGQYFETHQSITGQYYSVSSPIKSVCGQKELIIGSVHNVLWHQHLVPVLKTCTNHSSVL